MVVGVFSKTILIFALICVSERTRILHKKAVLSLLCPKQGCSFHHTHKLMAYFTGSFLSVRVYMYAEYNGGINAIHELGKNNNCCLRPIS
jgi:hypothetical protein